MHFLKLSLFVASACTILTANTPPPSPARVSRRLQPTSPLRLEQEQLPGSSTTQTMQSERVFFAEPKEPKKTTTGEDPVLFCSLLMRVIGTFLVTAPYRVSELTALMVERYGRASKIERRRIRKTIVSYTQGDLLPGEDMCLLVCSVLHQLIASTGDDPVLFCSLLMRVIVLFSAKAPHRISELTALMVEHYGKASESKRKRIRTTIVGVSQKILLPGEELASRYRLVCSVLRQLIVTHDKGLILITQ